MNGFTIDGNIDSLSASMAYLTFFEEGEFRIVDSVIIEDGKFDFKGEVETPGLYFIKFDDESNRIDLFLENSAISILGKTTLPENLNVSGSKVHDEFSAFRKNDNSYDDQIKDVIRAYRAAEASGNKDLLAKLDRKYEHIDSLRGVFITNYIKENPKSIIASYALISNMYRYDLKELKELRNQFTETVRASKYAIQISEKITALENSKVGKEAPLFTMKDVNEQPISLKSYRGKVVLVDFWASWCNPCRQENPNVVRAYNEYHAKGFDILGVSFDTDKEKWLQAIKDDGLVWKHVSDLKGWANAAGKLYAVTSIPHSVLLDENGVIIAKNLRGDELQKKLKEIFN
jgi:peroxiredoxin